MKKIGLLLSLLLIVSITLGQNWKTFLGSDFYFPGYSVRIIKANAHEVWFSNVFSIFKHDLSIDARTLFIDAGTANFPIGAKMDIIIDKYDKVWTMNYNDKKVYYYNGTTSWIPDVFSTGGVDFTLDTNNVRWVIGLELVKYDGSTITSYTSSNSGYPVNGGVIDVDNNNEIWIGGNKLIHFDGDTTWDIYPYMNGADIYIARKVTFNSANDVYVATDKGLLIFNDSTWSKFDTTNTPWPAEYVRALTLDANDGIWVGLSDGIIGPNYFGLWHYDGVTWENFTMYNSPLLFDKVDDIDVDELGNVWIGVALGYCVYNPNGLQGLVGINEQPSQTLHISISPNPTTGAATLHGENALRTGDKIEIRDIVGKLVTQLPIANNKNSVDLNMSDLPCGLYIVSVISANATYATKLIKK